MTAAPTGRWVEPVVLEGRAVRLEPLTSAHVPALAEAGADPAIWRWYIIEPLTTPARMGDWVAEALAAAEAGTEQAFVQIDRTSGRIVGSTRYMAIVPAHRRLEIGSTWLARAEQGTAINPEAKLLLVGHAIDHLGARRVEFKTDAANAPSRAALLGIGATFEGVHRQHMLRFDGGNRDSAWYSIIDAEWPTVRARLEARVADRLSSVPAARAGGAPAGGTPAGSRPSALVEQEDRPC